MIRAYNPLIEGWLAARCAKRLQIPFVLSVHTQYDLHRKRFRVSNLKKYLVLK
ncbi:MAG: glycosyltransferase family 1 protein, partial [Nitrosopumilaceae archaeon]|nr:glycosyltransferase family 4 protein [Nitrosopumilaceae archaeon]NIU87209.1 glycosyltransferase family 1 protein [Nitrosopumilaceae archaeon]NIV65717.1 glycosyltransferase family 1 protein [Nitrosopumilaceae archaeon]NIX61365.1 glycosyltransferase family 1 protein [Nitrosopumilaceae archaeon]